jgi:hypothetical protein
MRPERPETEATPLEPDHEYDLPGGPHLGHAAALNVPCSDGPATFDALDRESDEQELIAREPAVEPGRQMEAGTDFDEETERRLQPLFTPIRSR